MVGTPLKRARREAMAARALALAEGREPEPIPDHLLPVGVKRADAPYVHPLHWAQKFGLAVAPPGESPKAKRKAKAGQEPIRMAPVQIEDWHRKVVFHLAAFGVTQERIARRLGISEDTLVRHFSEELQASKEDLTNALKIVLTEKALGGDVQAAGMLLRAYGGPEWKQNAQARFSSDGSSFVLVIEDGGAGPTTIDGSVADSETPLLSGP